MRAGLLRFALGHNGRLSIVVSDALLFAFTRARLVGCQGYALREAPRILKKGDKPLVKAEQR
jgi:hypothetical protein